MPQSNAYIFACIDNETNEAIRTHYLAKNPKLKKYYFELSVASDYFFIQILAILLNVKNDFMIMIYDMIF